MGPSAAADLAVLVAAIVVMVAIAGKLVTSNMMARQKKRFAKLDAQRRGIAQQLTEVAAKRKSAEGTLHFWERRREEAERKVFDTRLDVEEHERTADPLGPEEGDEADAGEARADRGHTEDGLADDGLLTDDEAAPLESGEEASGDDDSTGGPDGTGLDETGPDEVGTDQQAEADASASAEEPSPESPEADRDDPPR